MIRSETALQGMAEIRSYVNRSESTVLLWIRELGFPATKAGGGIWESDKKLVDEWRREQIALGTISAKPRDSGRNKKKSAPRKPRW